MNKLQAEQCVKLAKMQGIEGEMQTWIIGEVGCAQFVIGDNWFKDYTEAIGYLAIERYIKENLLND